MKWIILPKYLSTIGNSRNKNAYLFLFSQFNVLVCLFLVQYVFFVFCGFVEQRMREAGGGMLDATKSTEH